MVTEQGHELSLTAESIPHCLVMLQVRFAGQLADPTTVEDAVSIRESFKI